MDSRWLKGAKDKEQRKKEVLAYRNAFDDLTEILEGWVENTSIRDYGPGWESKQIALNERNHALKEVLKFINIKENK